MPTAARAVAVSIATGAAAAALAGCGTSGQAPPQVSLSADREWIDNALRFTETLEADILLSANGGGNIASARQAIHDDSDVYSMLVAYTLFGGCGHALANTGTPGPRDGRAVRALAAACRRLEGSSKAFTSAMSRDDPHALLAATRLALGAEPLIARAKAELSALQGP